MGNSKLEAQRWRIGDYAGAPFNRLTLKQIEECTRKGRPSKKVVRAQERRARQDNFVKQFFRGQLERSLRHIFDGTPTLEDIYYVLKQTGRPEISTEDLSGNGLKATITTITVHGKVV